MTEDTPSRPSAKRNPGLGRGLSALFAETKQQVAIADAEAPEPVDDGGTLSRRAVQLLDIAAITPHPDQPRRQFNEEALAELAASVASRGVIQPIIVRPFGSGRYQIVAGERRWRAAQRAQLHRIPAIVRDFDESETLEIAIVENIQREDLNPVEEARAYRRLISQFGHSQDALGRMVGKSRSHVANIMRLLELPDAVQALLMTGQLQMGHARALIGAPDCERLADDVVRKKLSVRQTEQAVRAAREGSVPRAAGVGRGRQDGASADIAALERDLGDLLGLKVSIAHGDGERGAITLHYATLDQLDMLCQRLSGELV